MALISVDVVVVVDKIAVAVVVLLSFECNALRLQAISPAYRYCCCCGRPLYCLGAGSGG